MSPCQSVSSLLHMSEGAAPSSPGPASSQGMQNGDAGYALPRGKSQPAHTVPFTSPDALKVK